jgi:hypothetical protein
MDPSEIQLNTVTKMFEYEKISREIDTCDNIIELKNITKSYIKLYFSQQEVISNLHLQH